ncbi:MAG: DUF932 domain-containing protein [Proteobacteria bacterium]|nr:DUF932 domain-containing protein [Pseudomonadota bacterium]
MPAAFAPAAHESRSASYTFIPTAKVVDALYSVGFHPVEARQATRAKSPLHARHVIRFRRRFETVALKDAVPELLFLNSHDGTSVYQLRVGLYRAVCTNGLVVSVGAFPTFKVAHRGDVVADVVRAALEISERFGSLVTSVEHLECRHLDYLEQLDFASAALALRFPGRPECGLEPARLLVPRRAEDAGDDAWRVLNRVQENVLRGGIPRRTATNRLVRTRAITAIREDIRINAGLWDRALALLH